METMKFKTTIKCSGCVANVTPALNEVAGKDSWGVDTTVPDKILTITTEKEIAADAVIAAVNKAGYQAETVD